MKARNIRAARDVTYGSSTAGYSFVCATPRGHDFSTTTVVGNNSDCASDVSPATGLAIYSLGRTTTDPDAQVGLICVQKPNW